MSEAAVRFSVFGEVIGKGRPKFRRVGEYTQTYTPKRTSDYENLIRMEYETQVGRRAFFEKGKALAMSIFIYKEIPQSTSGKKRTQMLEGKILPGKRPDVDNCIKVVCDALNKVAFHDDSQIVQMNVEAVYDERPRMEITLWEVGING